MLFWYSYKRKSMEDMIQDNSIILLDTKFHPCDLDNQNVIVEINGEVICKKYNQQSDHIWFKSLNKNFSYEDRNYNNNRRIIGKLWKEYNKIVSWSITK